MDFPEICPINTFGCIVVVPKEAVVNFPSVTLLLHWWIGSLEILIAADLLPSCPVPSAGGPRDQRGACHRGSRSPLSNQHGSRSNATCADETGGVGDRIFKAGAVHALATPDPRSRNRVGANWRFYSLILDTAHLVFWFKYPRKTCRNSRLPIVTTQHAKVKEEKKRERNVASP